MNRATIIYLLFAFQFEADVGGQDVHRLRKPSTTAKNEKKVEICHIPPDDPDNFRTLQVGKNAVEAHIRNHNDLVGSCSENCHILCDDDNACTIDNPDGHDCEAMGCPAEREQVDCGSSLCVDNELLTFSCNQDEGCVETKQDCSRLDTGACILGVCDPINLVCATQNNDGASCDDGITCTTNDVCAAGNCAGTESCSFLDGDCKGGICDPEGSGECVEQHKSNDTPCNDGDACTVGDACLDGQCQAGDPIDCSGLSDDCNDGVCVSGACTTVIKANGIPCNDEDACTEGDKCQDGECSPGPVKDCPSTSECKQGVCQSDGSCTEENVPNGTSCDDGNECTENDQCQQGFCVAGPDKDCSPVTNGNECKEGICQSDGSCAAVNKVNGVPCSDYNACTEGDTCLSGSCASGPPKDCSHLDTECRFGVCVTPFGFCATQPKPNGISC